MLRRAALALVLSGGLLAGPAVAGEEFPAPGPGASQGVEPAAAVGDPVDRLVRWALALGGSLGLAGAAGLYWTRETR